MASKYDPFRLWLDRQTEDRIQLSFRDIEAILGFRLPASARSLAQWWANVAGSHAQASAWVSAGWRAREVDVRAEQVTFERVRHGQEAAGMSDNAAEYRLDEAIVIDPATLGGGVRRMLEDCREAEGGSLADAVVTLLNAMALERRRQLVDWFRANAPKVPGDSAELIREDRDAG